MAKLTPKQKRFVDEYLKDLNATQAAERAGYSDPSIGRRLVTKSHVSDYIQKREADRARRTELTQDRVLQELAAIALADIADFARIEKRWRHNLQGDLVEYGAVEFTPTLEIPKTKRGAIMAIKQGASGIEVKFNDKVRALELMGKHLGMFGADDANTADALARLDAILSGVGRKMDADEH